MDRKRTKIITITSIKGGVGKSTSAIIFATLLSKEYKVLLIDIDTQASTTSYFYEKIKENNIDLKKTNICEVLKDNLDINNCIINIEKNLNLIPSYLTLHSLNGDFYCLNKHKAIDLKLKIEIKRLKINYDYILIDTNPSLDLTLRCALNATHYIVIPMTAEKWTFESYELLEFFIKNLEKLVPIFFIITRFKKNNTHKELLKIMQKKNNFLGIVCEREGLNKKIATNSEFDLKSNYILEYSCILKNLISHIKIYSEKIEISKINCPALDNL
ncbi:chromosome partitioning protein ParA (plasmid) [Borreliella mayonii]|uniref:Chromosome partitioning protein ParA n=1 Tax=Borreliella mayonii TaxID=1674146 RepID=A0AAC9KY79_9SPIR|nr:ParA family protein [Borreliella mayonii]APS99252.1 chromosome partitioning protein ParA [Borreliella mayonii]APT00378.1 chromosome partitioning protein ParA [Borreliella mayonii]